MGWDDSFQGLMSKTIKLSQIPTPEEIHKGVCIYAPTERQFNALMEWLQILGWTWSGRVKPTNAKFLSSMCFVYLFPTPRYYIMRYKEFNASFDNYVFSECFTIEEWDDKVMEPKNNDGRGTCYWCGAPCKQVRGVVNTYNICTGCGK